MKEVPADRIISDEEYRVHQHWMQRALAMARQGGELTEIPVGAVLVDAEGQLVAAACNRKQREQDPTAHAEMQVIRAAARQLNSWRLLEHTLYVTLEPCPMCAGALVHARLKRLVYGASDFKTGAVRSVLNIPDSKASNHRLSVIGGVEEAACSELLKSWFARRRQ
ncbi:MAG: tRNA adenosine(34) deaminase TadA [Cyanobacteria bacterium P01_H01_bin.15]